MARVSRRRRSIARLWGDTEGSALIEATLLTPVLVTLVLGVLEFSWYFQKQQLVESGIRDAARYLARVAQDGTNPCTLTTPVNYADYAKNIAVTGKTSGGTARVTGWTTVNVNLTCSAVDNSSASYAGGSTLYVVTASTSFDDPALGFFSALKLTTPKLSATHSQRSIGPG